MDTIEAKKKRKREQDRARQSKCRAKKKKLKEELKKLKEDLLMKNYKNREAVRKHRERKRKGNTVRGKYKRKIQYIEGDIPATPAFKRECKNNDKKTNYRVILMSPFFIGQCDALWMKQVSKKKLVEKS